MLSLARMPGRWVFAAAILGLASSGWASPTNDDFIKRAFSDLLARPPSPTELSNYETILSTQTRQQAALDIVTGAEFHGDVAAGLYSLLLHRPPLSVERSSAVMSLGGGSTIEQVESGIAGSSEYFQNRGGASDDGFLNALYSDLLNRPVDPATRALFDQQLSHGTTTGQVAADVLGTSEYQTDLIGTYTMDYLHRPANSTDTSLYLGKLHSGTRDEVVISEIIGSTEYFNAVPEPAALPLCGAGAALLLTRRGRRRRN